MYNASEKRPDSFHPAKALVNAFITKIQIYPKMRVDQTEYGNTN
jgi:hypothetical protein